MRSTGKLFPQLLLLASSLALTFFYILFLSKTPLFLAAQYKTGDTLFKLHDTLKPPPKSQEIVVVSVDDESIYKLDRSWPWGRDVFAVFLEKIRPLEPKVIGFDFSFTGSAQDPRQDKWFADEIRKCGNVILASHFDRDSREYYYIQPQQSFDDAALGSGFVNIPYDQDEVNRRSRILLELRNGFAYTFATRIAYAYLGLSVEENVKMKGVHAELTLPNRRDPAERQRYLLPLDRKYHVPTTFRYQKGKIETISFWEFISGSVPAEKIRGKIVLVAPMSAVMHDVHSTPLGRMPGIFINANQIMMILNHDFVKKIWPYDHWLFLVFICGFFTFAFYRASYVQSLVLLLAAEIFAYNTALFFFFNYGLIFSLFSTMVVILLTFLTVLFYKGLTIFLENAALKREVVTDALTGLYSHSYVQRRLESDFNRAKSTGKRLCFVMVDVDYFKRVNDQYGHQQGNQVLIHIAKILKNGMRGVDVAARYGGEEFSMILADCDPQDAYHTLRRISRSIEALEFETEKGNFNVTISAGICSNLHPEVRTKNDLIALADKALYTAKTTGRNRVCIYGDTAGGRPEVKKV